MYMRMLSAIFSLGIITTVAWAEVPKQINHQGMVTVNGTRFSGSGQFRFAIVDPDANQNVWTNNNSEVPGPGMPSAAVLITVVNGVYSVRLGDPALANMTSEIPPAVFNNPNLSLRIWFDDAVNGNQQLSPDQKLSASPYAHRAEVTPPLGAIIAWHKNADGVPSQLPEGWVECNGPFANDDAATPVDERDVPDLNNQVLGYAGARFLRGGTQSGEYQDGTTFVQTNANNGLWNQTFINVLDDHDGEIGTTAYTVNLSGVCCDNGARPITGAHARPVNMTVVWIMRVK